MRDDYEDYEDEDYNQDEDFDYFDDEDEGISSNNCDDDDYENPDSEYDDE